MGVLQFDRRKTYFDGCGEKLDNNAMTSRDVMRLAGLDYTVEKQQLYLADGNPAPKCFATVRTDTNEVIGAVGEKYQVLQNYEAFDFLDSLYDEGAVFTNAGQVGGKVFVVAETEPMKICGDEFKPYILFNNSFDGSTGISAMFTPIRVFCSNCFVQATRAADHKIRIRHSTNAKEKLYIARDVLLENTKYLKYLKERSERLACIKVSRDEFIDTVKTVVAPKEGKETELRLERAEDALMNILKCYNQDDLQNFNDTAWKAIMAVADYDSHKEPGRDTNNEFYAMSRVMRGMLLLNMFTAELGKRIGMKLY